MRPPTSPPGRRSRSERLEGDLRELRATIQDPGLSELLERFFAPDSEVFERFRDAPAAKVYHQAYRHGLLEHTVSVAQAVSAASAALFGGNRPRCRGRRRPPARHRQDGGLQPRNPRAIDLN